nr:ribonuclease H-like domain, reverse transcriptase, RNA-dependent DNA polymerase [Tanacetum cinerariifolium]
MRPFRCHVIILNTLDHLGKFDGKVDEGYFVRYSMNSKAFRLYNIRTRKVEENLHTEFLENKPIVAGAGLEWLFNIDMLIKSMNYVPVIAGTNSDNFLSNDARSPSSGDARKKHDEVSDKDSRALNELNYAFKNLNIDYPDDPKMPGLDTIATYDDSKEDADFTNLESSIHVSPSPTPTTRTHKNHLLKQMSSMGEVTFLLGLKVKQTEYGIFISQDKYVTEVSRKFNFSDVQSANTPVDTEKTLVKDADGANVDVHLYRSMIRSLMYLTASRPDIILISWQYKKETVVATSTTKAEYVAAASCCRQVLWIPN